MFLRFFLYFQFYCRDILTNGLKKCTALPRPDMTSVYTSLDITDVDFDGHKEILIGTSAEVTIITNDTSIAFSLCTCRKYFSTDLCPMMNGG